MTDEKKAKTILAIEKLRLIESELFRLTSKYGVKTIDDLDKRIKEGLLSEKTVGDDLFTFDYLLSEKGQLEKELLKLKVKNADIWKSLKSLLELPKLSSQI